MREKPRPKDRPTDRTEEETDRAGEGLCACTNSKAEGRGGGRGGVGLCATPCPPRPRLELSRGTAKVPGDAGGKRRQTEGGRGGGVQAAAQEGTWSPGCGRRGRRLLARSTRREGEAGSEARAALQAGESVANHPRPRPQARLSRSPAGRGLRQRQAARQLGLQAQWRALRGPSHGQPAWHQAPFAWRSGDGPVPPKKDGLGSAGLCGVLVPGGPRGAGKGPRGTLGLAPPTSSLAGQDGPCACPKPCLTSGVEPA